MALVWVGIRTTEYPATFAFFRDVLGLDVHASEADFAVLDVPGSCSWSAARSARLPTSTTISRELHGASPTAVPA